MIAAARKAAGLSHKEAADLIYGTAASWRAWEEGSRPMHAGLWELFKIKTLDHAVLRALGLMPRPPDSVPLLNPDAPRNRSIADEDDCAPD